MKRTTLYLAPELEMLLKSEMLRQNRPMAEIVREAVEAYVTREPRKPPPGAGAFASGHADTAERADAILQETGFGEVGTGAGKRPAPREPGRRLGARKRARR
jgi:hypothetical protein